jgi:hypothetical protein
MDKQYLERLSDKIVERALEASGVDELAVGVDTVLQTILWQLSEDELSLIVELCKRKVDSYYTVYGGFFSAISPEGSFEIQPVVCSRPSQKQARLSVMQSALICYPLADGYTGHRADFLVAYVPER